MRSRGNRFVLGYSGEIAVSEDHLIVAQRVTQSGNENDGLEPMVKLVKHWWARLIWGLYPLLVTFVVVATANHFFIDVFLGALTAGAAALIANRLLARARPEVWTFGEVPA